MRRERFDIAAEMAEIGSHSRNIGAICSFVGLCRDEGGVVSALEIEHYPAMANLEIEAIAARAAARFSLIALTIFHRYGYLSVGEEIVLIVAASQHRTSAFEAVDFVMDYLKTDAPFWKKAHFNEARAATWIKAQERDDIRRTRWE